MAVTVSSALLSSANAAASSAPNGSKNLAFCSAISTGIGTGYRIVARRNGGVVLDLSAGESTALIPSGAGLSVPDSFSIENTFESADLDSGTWTLRIERSDDPSVYLHGTLARSGADFALSDDLDPQRGVALSGIFLRSPSIDTGGGGSSTLTPADSRVFAWVDPNIAWASQPSLSNGPVPTMQVSNTWNASKTIKQVPEPGIIGAGSEYTFSRVADPDDATKKAILHRVDNSFPKWNGTARSQFVNAFLADGQTYWLGYQVRLSPDCFASGNTSSLGDVHHNNWDNGPYGRPSRAARAPINMYLSGSGNGAMTFSVAGCYINNFQTSQITETTIYQSGATSPGDWHRFVMRFKLGRSMSDSPSVMLWHQINNGAENAVANVSGVPIGYNDTPPNQDYVKFVGLYQWDSSITRRTVHTKGLIVIRDAAGSPTLSSSEIFALLRSL